MNSLDEFQFLESMLKKSEESLTKHQRKKHKTDLLVDMEANSEDDKSNSNETKFLELENIVMNVLSSSQPNGDQELRSKEIIKRLYQRLCHERQEVKHSESLASEKLENIRQQMKDLTSQIAHKHKAVKSSECQTDLPTSPSLNLEASFENCRRQMHNHSSSVSTMTLDNLADQQQHSKSSTVAVDNGNFALDDCDPKFKKMLLDQIKLHEEKIHTERLSYIAENERLNGIIDEKLRIVDELQCQLKQITSTVSSTSSAKSSFLDDSRVHGLFDWPIEESAGEQTLAGDTVFDQANAYSTTTNNRTLHVLSDLVQTFLDTEKDIQRRLETLGLESKAAQPDDSGLLGFPSLDDERISDLTFDGLCDDGPDLTPSSMVYSSHSLNATSNDIEDDVVLGASRRLRLAVERVLSILSGLADHHSQHDIKELLKQKDELALELQEEVQRRDKLTRQLLEKESALHSVESEKRSLVERTADYAEVKVEREQLKLKLEEYERDRDKFLSDHQRFELEKSTFAQGLQPLQQKLMRENEVLNRDINQLQQDKRSLAKKINSLTSEVETLKSEKEQIIESKNAEFDELISQIESTEKNHSALKRFVEEQTQEREFEREEYNKEIVALKEKLKEKEKVETKVKANLRSLESQVTFLNEDKVLRDEQFEENSSSLKEANLKIAELNLTVRQLETDLERNSQVEVQLRNKLKELSSVLNIKLNDEANWQDLLSAIAKVSEAKQGEPVQTALSSKEPAIELSIENIDRNVQKHLGSSSLGDNSVFLTIKLMDDKMQVLNGQVDTLLVKNGQLKEELRQTNECIAKFDQIKSQMGGVERILHETQKENEMLHQEINENHMKYSELKVKLESSVDVIEFKKVVSELQSKLLAEKKHTELVMVKLEQATRHVGELEEKLDAYKKETKSYKELIKSHELDGKHSKERGELKNKYDGALFEVNQLNTKVANKEKTISILETNIEMLKSKLTSIAQEKDLYFEKLQSIDESQNKIVVYEKNLEKLRLQNKMSCDKITYLELEIRSLRKKIDILERENDYLKLENQKLLKLRAEVSAAMSESEENGDSLSLALNPNCNGNLYLNGLDKINSISSNNLLMLKVRRLLSQKGALIYQKNYLIHLLGGFQMTENATLALLSNLNHTKDVEDMDSKMRGKQKFRSVVYAMIALNRMRFLVNIWQCRKRQLLVSKTAHSISSHLENLPVPPKKRNSSGTNSMRSTSSSASSSPVHFPKHTSLTSQINSTMKDYVDRLHVVHETLGLHTNKL